MLRHRILAIVALSAALLVLAGGGLVGAHMLQTQTPQTSQTPATTLTLDQHTWKLKSFTVEGREQTLVADAPITLSFDAQRKRVSGSSGCNTYNATYSLSQNTSHLTMSDERITLVACGKPGVMEQEARYMTAFAQVTTYHLDQTRLTLRDDAGQYILQYM